MTTYYVSSVDGSNADDGLSWANAKASLSENTAAGANGAIATASGTGPHLIYVDSAHSEAMTADATMTALADLRIISVNRSGSDAPLAGAIVGSQATNYAVTLGGAFDCYVYGISFRNGQGNSSKEVSLGSTDGNHFEFESCDVYLSGTGSGSAAKIGTTGSATNVWVTLRNFAVRFGAASQKLWLMGRGEAIGLSVSLANSGAAPTKLLGCQGNGIVWTIDGSDLSNIGSSTVVENAASVGSISFTFINCKFGSGTILEDPTTVLNRGQTTVWAFNCASGDTHYAMFHGDAFGTTTVSTVIYANDGASYDGTNRCSWVITTRASNCSFFTPYVSPWIEMYNADVSTSITPYLEGLRDGSATVIQDDEVWAEFSRQGTSGYPLAVFSNDRMTLLGTPANQTSTLAAGDWTGEAGTYSTFKLAAPSAFTPAEIGPLKARVIVGEPGLTIYVDPKVRT
jgi:hypothetical protein